MKNILYLLLILTFQSCLNLTEPEHQAQYIESYRSFDREMVNHFPQKIPNNWIYLCEGSPKFINEYCGVAELNLEIQVTSKEKFKKLRKQFIEDAKILKSSTDSCFLIVNSKENQNFSICNNYFPIPKETIYDFVGNQWIKQDSCEVALIDYKPGVFVNNKYLTAKEYLPENWRNGYSKGYSFDNSKQTILYWLIIW